MSRDIDVGEISLLGLVSVYACWQLVQFAKRVGESRKKCGVKYPQVTGHPDFERVIRAQQNTLEFFPVFFTLFWIAGLFLHQIPACVVGLVYIYSRYLYFNGYAEETEKRIPGFKLGVKCLMALLVLALVGAGNAAISHYFRVDLIAKVVKMLPKSLRMF